MGVLASKMSVLGNPEQHESIIPGNVATGISAGLLEDAGGKNPVGAIISVEDNDIRYNINGTTPTNTNGTSADVGHAAFANQSWTLNGVGAVASFKCIDKISGSVAVVKITTFYV